jgi:peptidoglycan/xylan/chitin deacetylase (PgdA/CDA1 family)
MQKTASGTRCQDGRSCIQGVAMAMVVAVAAFVSACATRAPEMPAASTPAIDPVTSAVPMVGKVLGRSDRFIVYQPIVGETLRSIAARFLGSESRDWVIGDFNGIAQAEADRPLVVPLKSINPMGVYADQYQTVPILCYHRFGNGSVTGTINGNGAAKMAMSGSNFAAQLEWLAHNDYHVIPLSQLVGFLEGRQALPKRSVVITIDDGYESVHRIALPLLRKYGFPATLFVYSDFVGASDALSWAQLQDLTASGLVDVQAHSKTHRNLIEHDAADTDDRYRQMLETEARTPRDILERKLQIQVRQYAYPYGDANQAVLDVLTRQRYQVGVTVNPGGNGFFAQPLMLRRTMIYGDQDLTSFKLKLQIARATGLP